MKHILLQKFYHGELGNTQVEREFMNSMQSLHRKNGETPAERNAQDDLETNGTHGASYPPNGDFTKLFGPSEEIPFGLSQSVPREKRLQVLKDRGFGDDVPKELSKRKNSFLALSNDSSLELVSIYSEKEAELKGSIFNRTERSSSSSNSSMISYPWRKTSITSFNEFRKGLDNVTFQKSGIGIETWNEGKDLPNDEDPYLAEDYEIINSLMSMEEPLKAFHKWALNTLASETHPLGVKLSQYVRSFQTSHSLIAHLIHDEKISSLTFDQMLAKAKDAVLELQYFLLSLFEFFQLMYPDIEKYEELRACLYYPIEETLFLSVI